MSLEVRIRKKLNSFTLDVDFETGEGVFALLGPSGCGKSMTLKCIAGIEKPDFGRIILNGRVLFDSEKKIDLPPQKRHVGYMFQDYALFPNMTVRENVLAGMSPAGHAPEHREPDGFGDSGGKKTGNPAGRRNLFALRRGRRPDPSAADRLLERFHIADLSEEYPPKLSGGQKQRVAMARIIAQDPDVILLDEPFSALDSYLRWQLEQEMKETLSRIQRPVIFVSHSRDEVFRLAKTVLCIEKGRSGTAQPVKEFFDHPGTKAAAIVSGCKNVTPARRVSAHELLLPEWGVTVTVRREIPGNTAYAGIRAHAFTEEPVPASDNCLPVKMAAAIEELFEWTVSFRASESGAMIQWKCSKAVMPEMRMPEKLYFNSDDLMLLED